MKAIIADTEHVAAITQDFGDDTVVVVFNPLGFVRNSDRFWIDEPFLRHRISAIGIVTSAENFYPPSGMKEVIPKVLNALCGRRVITFGSNHGGYGALKFARALGASVALAFNPIWSIRREDVGGFDARLLQYYNERLGSGDKITADDLGSQAFVFHDPGMPVESRHAAKILELDRTAAIVCPFSKSETIRLVTDGSAIADLVRLCSTPSRPPSAREIRNLIRAERQKSEVYSFQIISHLLKRAKTSPAFFESYVRRFPRPESEAASAVLSFLKGDPDHADALLTKTSATSLNAANLRNCRKLCEDFSFPAGELLFANLILSNYPKNIHLCLQAVPTLIRQGLRDRAADELLKLAERDDAYLYWGHFARFAGELRRPESLELLVSRSIPRPARLNGMFALADYYHEQRERPKAVKVLRDAMPLCTDSTADQIRLSRHLGTVGEWSAALQVRQDLARKDPKNASLQIDVIQAKASTSKAFQHRSALMVELRALTASLTLDAPLWERVSYIYGELESLPDAMDAIERAIRLRRDNFNYRRRRISLLRTFNRWSEVRAELRKLLTEAKADPHWLRQFSDESMASKSERDRPKMHALARSFAEAQYAGRETDPKAVLFLAQIYRRTGDRSRALMPLTTLFQAERGRPTLSDADWAGLAEELFEVERGPMAKAALAEVLRRQPDNDIAKKKLETITSLEKRGMLGHIPALASQPRPRFRLRLFG